MNKLQPLALGVGVGVLWAAYVFIAGIAAMNGWGTALVDVFGSLYIGYNASIAGAFIGAMWALVDGFIAGAVIAWIYNGIAISEHNSKATRVGTDGQPAESTPHR